MDVAHPWGYGGSGWVEFPRHRIIGGFNYRGTSWGWVHGSPPHAPTADANFVLLVDTPDFRMRGEKIANNAHGGYNIIYNDGSGFFFADEGYTVDAIARLGGGRVDDRGQRHIDEQIYQHLATVIAPCD